MGKGKGKLKKNIKVAANEQNASGGEEKTAPLTRRGRPRKLLKKEIEEKEKTKLVEEEEVIDNVGEENSRKRKKSYETEESVDSVEEEDGAKRSDVMNDSSVKSMGFRHSRSRRKNKPRRAAEVGVECYCY